jgi:hypothetical protein
MSHITLSSSFHHHQSWTSSYIHHNITCHRAVKGHDQPPRSNPRAGQGPKLSNGNRHRITCHRAVKGHDQPPRNNPGAGHRPKLGSGRGHAGTGHLSPSDRGRDQHPDGTPGASQEPTEAVRGGQGPKDREAQTPTVYPPENAHSIAI